MRAGYLSARALRVALGAALVSRVIAWAAALVAPSLPGDVEANDLFFDLPRVTHPFGSHAVNSFFGALAHWDGVWFLLIANEGYVGPHGIPSALGSAPWHGSLGFFPGYPSVVRVLSGFAVSPAVVVVVAYMVSLATFVVALYFVYRLAELEMGAKAAMWCTILFALFPGAVFFGTPYAESLFAALCASCLYAARTGRWPVACLLAGAAIVTRSPGMLLVVPLALFYLYDPTGRRARRPIRADALWLLAVPAALVAYVVYCWHLTGDPFAINAVGKAYHRGFMDPFTATFQAFRAGAQAYTVFLFGVDHSPEYAAFRYADLGGLLAFIAAVPLTVLVFRDLPRPYGWFCVASLLLFLGSGPDHHPLSSSMRYLATVPPLFIEAGRLVEDRPRIAWAAATVMAVSLALVTSAYARWLFVG